MSCMCGENELEHGGDADETASLDATEKTIIMRVDVEQDPEDKRA